MSDIREIVDTYVKRVRELIDHVKGNEQATKQSLIGPFFTMLGYDLTDPRECVPEFKVDFGKDRSTKPIDWAFMHSGTYAFFVEAKSAGGKLAGFDEQLADYFAKDPHVKLGVLTNGVQWRFFTDVVNNNVMDREPFARWDVLADDSAPYDVLTLLHKAKFNPELIRTYAQRQREKNLLVGELTRLLEPASEFTRLAIENIETRTRTQAVVDSWKPIVASALVEWARQRMLTAALSTPAPSNDASIEAPKVETTPNELAAFAAAKKLLGAERPIAYEDTVSYFKIHIPERKSWVIARLQLDRKQPYLWVPLPLDKVTPLVGARPANIVQGWACISLADNKDVANLGDVLIASYAWVKSGRAGAAA